MAARYDKYDPTNGGFRAKIAANTSKSTGNPVGVGLNSSGAVVAGAGQTGIKGILLLTEDKKAGDVVDVMTDGEVVDCASLAAGTTYYVNDTTGALQTSSSGGTKVAFTVEATRLVVRLGR